MEGEVNTLAQNTGTISVVIPAYNASHFLARAVRSALEQTLPALEVIIIDDGSTDDTLTAAHRLADEDARVEVIALDENRGPAAARNAGFAAAKGDWIAVLDADDAFLPDRLKHMMTLSEGADIIADNLVSYDPTTERVSPPSSAQTEGWERIDLLSFAEARRGHEDFGLFQPIFRRAFLEQHHLRYLEDVRHGEDYLLVFEAIARGAEYRLTWQPGYLYTCRSSGWSRTALDYARMSANLRILANCPELDLPITVRAKLRQRLAFIDYLHVREQAKRLIREGDVLRAIVTTVASRGIWRFLFSEISRILRMG